MMETNVRTKVSHKLCSPTSRFTTGSFKMQSLRCVLTIILHMISDKAETASCHRWAALFLHSSSTGKPSLSVKRGLQMAYKWLSAFMKGIDKVEMEHFFELDDGGGYDLRGHSLKVKVQRSRLLLRQGYFSQRVVCAWNSLPASVVELPLSSCSRRGWMIGVKMWIFNASASRSLQSYKLHNSIMSIIIPYMPLTMFPAVLINCVHSLRD